MEYLVLPYIDFGKDFSFGDFQVWNNTAKNWRKNTGHNNKEFLKRFVDNKGRQLKNIYIVTSKKEIPYLKWERLIHTLFIISFPSYSFRFPKIFSDNFYFEIWKFNPQQSQDGYRKLDKFVNTIVVPTVKEKIFPDQHVTLGLKINIDVSDTRYEFFEQEFIKDYDASLMRSISFFFKTQYRNIFYFSLLDDVVNYSSAFQIILKVTDRRDLHKHIAKKLADQFDVNIVTKEKVKEWMQKFYRDIRSLHTHTGETDYSKITQTGIRQIDIAGMVYELLIDMQYLTDSFHRTLINSRIIEIFDSQRIFDGTLKLLTKKGAKDYFYNCNDQKFNKIHNQLLDFAVYCKSEFVTKKNNNKIFTSLKTLTCMIEHFCITYCNGFNPYLEPIQKICEHVQSSKTFKDGIEKMPTFFMKESEKLDGTYVRNDVSLKLLLEIFDLLRFMYG